MESKYEEIVKEIKRITRPFRHKVYWGTVNTVDQFKAALGYDFGQWVRTVMYEELFQWMEEIEPSKLDALEISSGNTWQRFPFKSFTETHYPEFNICEECLDRKFDLIIADQVFEHLLWPYRAGKNVYEMLNPGGYFIITTPFLIRVHEAPVDYTRWTETGLKYFLAECGFPLDKIRTGSWGNRNCVKVNLNKWVDRGWFRPMHKEADYPVSVWALAQK